ncbi:MAG: TRAP transporter substrate-binding protein [Pirellulaceae bacterium]|jgi:TRAP-type C4-dicarboxylate transport system substrate-binding protein|nr:TRAP transporter substrate-binding protein [Pirellulaceae bacterium]
MNYKRNEREAAGKKTPRGLHRRDVFKGAAALALGAAASTIGFPAVIRSAQAKKFLKPLVAGLNGKAGDPTVESIAMIPKILREKYDVELQIDVHPAGSLGTDVSHLEAVQSGFIDITSHGSAWLAHTDAFAIADLPYVISDWDMALRFFQSDFHKRLASKMEGDIPVKVLPSVSGGGFRWLLNNKRQLRTPDDVQGLKFRTTQSPILQALMRAWGGNPTSMAFPELYTALQQGVVDGDHFQPIWVYKFNFFEVISHATDVDAVFGFAVQVLNRNTWNAMPEDIQKAFMLAAQDAADLANKQDRDFHADFVQKNKDKGMTVYTPTPREKQQWREKGETVWADAGVDRALIDAMVALQTS